MLLTPKMARFLLFFWFFFHADRGTHNSPGSTSQHCTCREETGKKYINTWGFHFILWVPRFHFHVLCKRHGIKQYKSFFHVFLALNVSSSLLALVGKKFLSPHQWMLSHHHHLTTAPPFTFPRLRSSMHSPLSQSHHSSLRQPHSVLDRYQQPPCPHFTRQRQARLRRLRFATCHSNFSSSLRYVHL